MTSSRLTRSQKIALKGRDQSEASLIAGSIGALSNNLDTINTSISTLNTSLLAQNEPAGARGAFGRLRTVDPATLFDSKQLFDNGPLYWNDAEVSGTGTSSTHSTARASTVIGVGATTAGKRVRQTYQRFNYQPGKSQLAMFTGILVASGGGAGITCRIGLFDDDNGVFWEYDGGTLNVVVRSKVSGSAVDTEVAQSSFNGDKLDGTGASGVTIDVTKVQIFWIDYEWLGVGTVRFGVFVDGEMIIAHSAHAANTGTAVYMSTPNLPVRYAIENSGAGAASTLEHICSTVIAEGGHRSIGALWAKSNEGTAVTLTTSGTIYALLGIRLKSTHLGAMIDLEALDMIARNTVDFIWSLRWNPTVAGTFTYSDLDSASAIQTAVGTSANTVTGGKVMRTGYVKSSATTGDILQGLTNALRLGASIAGTRDEIVLCASPLSNAGSAEGSLSWREMS